MRQTMRWAVRQAMGWTMRQTMRWTMGWTMGWTMRSPGCRIRPAWARPMSRYGLAARRLPVLMPVLLGLAAIASPATADTLWLPGVLDRSGAASALWRIDPPISTDATLTVQWTDTEGRLVERHVIPVPAGAAAVPVAIDPRRALTRRNTLAGDLVLPGATRQARVDFTTPPTRPYGPAGWTDYQVIMWQEGGAGRAAGLRRLGVTGGMMMADRDGTGAAATVRRTEAFGQADLAWYVENIATDFYAAYHRWQPGKPVTWLYDETRRLQAEDPAAPAGYVRVPSLSDPAWIERVRVRLAEHVRVHGPNRPLYYSLGDEVGIADLTAFWDFDLSPESLAGFRDWLLADYGSLAALNRQWATDHATWAQVMPMLTDAALRRTDDNLSAWSDFKDWMDEAFARALRAGTDAIHAADASALSGIEGMQVPGWGGFDYTRLAHAVDLMEAGNGGHNVEIARSLNPALIVLSTSFGQGAEQRRELWRQILLGSRGVILWDGEGDIVTEDGQPGPRGRDLAPTIAELRNGLAAQLFATAAPTDPVAVLVSPPSFRVHWLLDRRADGIAWQKRDAETEHDNPTADRRSLARTMQHLTGLGIRPRFLSPKLLGAASGAKSLFAEGVRVLILPQTIALSDPEAAAVREFAAAGGLVLADGPVGLFDGHARRRPASVLEGIAISRPPALATTAPAGDVARVVAPGAGSTDPAAARAELAGLLRAAGVVPAYALQAADGKPVMGTELRRFQVGGVRLLSVMAAAAGAVEPSTLVLPSPTWVSDLRRGGPAVLTDRVAVSPPPDGPLLLALSPTPPRKPILSGPNTVEVGTLVPVQLGLSPPSGGDATAGATHVLHIEVIDPLGQARDRLTENVTVGAGPTPWLLRLALNDPTGQWVVRATDRLGGGTVELAIVVLPVAPR